MSNYPTVAECVSTALHTETVLYIVQQYAQQRQAAASKNAGGNAGGNSHLNDSEYYSDGEGSEASAQLFTSGDVIYHTLENMGVHTGLRLTERLLCREPLSSFLPDVVGRFIAGPVWVAVFGKPSEILQANDYDVVELRDASFRWIRSCSFRSFENSATNTLHTAPGYGPDGTALTDGAPISDHPSKQQQQAGSSTAPAQDSEEAGPADFVVYTCGILRGVLQTLGHPHAAVSFQVMGPTSSPQMPGHQNGGNYDNAGFGEGLDGGHSSLLNLTDVRFTIDFRGERAFLAGR